jgi:hypothetical protein
MKSPGLGLLLALGLLLHFDQAGAQASHPCPESLRLFQIGFGASTHQNRRGASSPVGYYVSPQGRLCEVLRPRQPFEGKQATEIPGPSPGRAVLLSALVPGAGQRLLGQGRWTAYLAAEIWAWIQYWQRKSEGRDLQRRYRDLAWFVARRVSSGHRIDGDFEYYEAMTKFPSSGAYDLNPTSNGVQPETDPETYNGSIWSLAQEIFFPDEGAPVPGEGSDQYKKALRYYLGRAFPGHLAWNWGDNALHQLEFTDLIRKSDENLRRSTTMVGIILANHLLSSVDALISARLRAEEDSGPGLDLLAYPGPRGAVGLALQISLPPH